MKKICIVGGDKRLEIAKNLLEKENFFVDSLGLYPEDNGDIALSDILLLPVPTTKDGNTVYTPETNKKIYLSDIEKVAQNKLILCCNYKFNMVYFSSSNFEERGLRYVKNLRRIR